MKSLQYYVRCLFSYDPTKDSLLPCTEIGLPFRYGDILQVMAIARHNFSTLVFGDHPGGEWGGPKLVAGQARGRRHHRAHPLPGLGGAEEVFCGQAGHILHL